MKKFKKSVADRLFSDTLPDYIKDLSDQELIDLDTKFDEQRQRFIKTRRPSKESLKILDRIKSMINDEQSKRKKTDEE